jgi:drug/metabolite transporter (DMT)-like permease
MVMNNDILATILIGLSALVYAPSIAISKKLFSVIDPITYVFIISVVGGLLFAIFYLLKFRKFPKFSGGEIKYVIIIMLIAGIVRLSVFYALNYTFVKNMSFISPVSSNIFVVLFSWLILKEKINKKVILGGFIGLLGSILIATKGMISIPSWGDFLIMFAMMLESIRVISIKKLMDKKRNAYETGFISIFGAGLTILIFSVLFLPIQSAHLNTNSVLLLTYVIVGSIIIGKLLYLFGLEKLKAYHTMLLYTIFSPLITSFFGVLILGEVFMSYDLIGAGLSIAGLTIMNWKGSNKMNN